MRDEMGAISLKVEFKEINSTTVPSRMFKMLALT
jgi:hypothetical protein